MTNLNKNFPYRVAPYNQDILRIVNDVHKGSKYCDFSNVTEQLDSLVPDGRTYLNGDIVDLSCCPSKQVSLLRSYQNSLIKKWGKAYIRGNHDLLPSGPSYAIHTLSNGDRVLITHGHLVGDKKRVGKWMKYENKEAGAGRFKLMWVDFADDMDWLKGIANKPKDDVIKAAVFMARLHNCKFVILGHFHPLKRLEIKEEEILILILPKGFNEVDFTKWM